MKNILFLCFFYLVYKVVFSLWCFVWFKKHNWCLQSAIEHCFHKYPNFIWENDTLGYKLYWNFFLLNSNNIYYKKWIRENGNFFADEIYRSFWGNGRGDLQGLRTLLKLKESQFFGRVPVFCGTDIHTCSFIYV